jgi:AcrR family transcriptional regulator
VAVVRSSSMSDDMRTRILGAVEQVATRLGLNRLTIEHVARVAGVARPTIYRYFNSRDELIGAYILREEQQLMAELAAAATAHGDARKALEAVIARILHLAREHPVLDRLIATEPEALLPYLTTGHGPVFAAAEPFVRGLLDEWAPHLTPELRDRGAEVAVRIIVSYAIASPQGDIDTVAYELAELLAYGALGPGGVPAR